MLCKIHYIERCLQCNVLETNYLKLSFSFRYSNDDYDTLLHEWIMDIPERFHELDLLEPILSLRTVLLQELLSLSQKDPTAMELKQSLLPALGRHCEIVSKLARHAGCYQVRLLYGVYHYRYYMHGGAKI